MMYFEDNISSLKSTNTIRCFLRHDPKTESTQYDDNYILNQLEATQYFFMWFSNPTSNYIEMLKKEHEFAAVGATKNREYKIYVPFRNEFAPDGWYKRYHGTGLLRTYFAENGVEHPNKDMLRISRNKYDIFKNEKYFMEIYDEKKDTILIDHAKTAKVVLSTVNYKIERIFRIWKNKYIVVKHPEKDEYLLYQSICESSMIYINKLYKNTGNIPLDIIGEYFQTFICWMPFVHINSSIAWEHVNVLLSLIDYKPVSHGDMDIMALLLSTDNFIKIFKEHIEQQQ